MIGHYTGGPFHFLNHLELQQICARNGIAPMTSPVDNTNLVKSKCLNAIETFLQLRPNDCLWLKREEFDKLIHSNRKELTEVYRVRIWRERVNEFEPAMKKTKISANHYPTNNDHRNYMPYNNSEKRSANAPVFYRTPSYNAPRPLFTQQQLRPVIDLNSLLSSPDSTLLGPYESIDDIPKGINGQIVTIAVPIGIPPPKFHTTQNCHSFQMIPPPPSSTSRATSSPPPLPPPPPTESGKDNDRSGEEAFYTKFFHLSLVSLQKGNFRDALSNLTNFLRFKPNHEEALYLKSKLLYRMSDFEGSLECLSSLLQMTMGDSKSQRRRGKWYRRCGMIYYQKKKYSEAVRVFGRALKLNEEEKSYKGRAESYFMMKEWDLALMDVEEAIRRVSCERKEEGAKKRERELLFLRHKILEEKKRNSFGL